MRIEGYKEMRGGDITSGRIPVYKEQFLKRHNPIFSNHTKLERRKR